ncbi:regulator of chromosome condensation 1/beta-lactamase-inhibitor protein II [Scleroderma citrinum]
MLRAATSRCMRLHSRALYTRSTTQLSQSAWSRSAIFATATASAAAVAVWCISNRNVTHCDATATSPPQVSAVENGHGDSSINSTGVDENGSIHAVVWGSNKSNIIDPKAPDIVTIQRPTNVKWFENVALRDLVLHEHHAACVDGRGDVYQWGNGFFGSLPTAKAEVRKPKATLRGKDIVRLQLTESRVYALSSSGKVYAFVANEEQQKRLVGPTNSSWWGIGWLWGGDQTTIDFVELLPREKLNWREYFTSIAAGRDHLLALTSAGRTYSHPVNKTANSHGQLGLRNVNLPVTPGAVGSESQTRITVELTPKSVADPYAKASPYSRVPLSSSSASETLDIVNDKHIRFSDSLFEIPALKGVMVSQIAAGSRSSHVITDAGRVLGWGANEFGQIGLGRDISLDTIIVPTEVVLTRSTPAHVKTKCLQISASGDLTFFVAERTGADPPRYVDVLSCGNGQWGGLGINLYTTAQANPVRVKNVSGLLEYDEKIRGLAPVMPETISISPTNHVLFTLDTLSRAGPGATGQDLLVCGFNYDYQLGTGNRKSLSVPTILQRPEGGRFLLGRRRATVMDMAGRVWRRNIEVEQCAVAGYGNSFVYWRIRP